MKGGFAKPSAPKNETMVKIILQTKIQAPRERVFDLARSIDLHKASTSKTNEEAIEGRVSGLIGLNETVTWRAKHFGIYQKLKVQIVEYDRPKMFKDVMLKGTFKSMHHTHSFEEENDFTIMNDVFEFESPLGFLGKIAEVLFLKKYMKNFLAKKNQTLKEVAESNQWKTLLNENLD